jgi:hypothetical protein
MRAVVLGLVGVVLAGQAWAGECPLDRAVVEVRDTGERFWDAKLARPDLSGQRFRVTRYVNHLIAPPPEWEGSDRIGGYEAIELTGNAGRFAVKVEHTGGSPPLWVSSESRPSRQSAIDWTSAGSGELEPRGGQSFYVFDGPLASLTVSVVGCR